MGERGNEKMAWGAASGEINVERGAGSGLAKENVETTKTGGDTGPIRGDGAESMSKLVWY